MFSLVLKAVLTLLATASLALANEGGGHGGGEKKEEKKEEKAEGGHAEKKPEVKSAEESFNVVQARVQTLEAKVKSAEDEIQKLIVEKQHTKDTQKVNEIIKQMLTLHRELQKNAKEYDQQRALLKYRYPEKGQSEEREYERHEVKSLEDMESQMSLTSSVKRTLKKVRSQYGTAEASDPGGERVPRKKPVKINPPSLVDPVILKK